MVLICTVWDCAETVSEGGSRENETKEPKEITMATVKTIATKEKTVFTSFVMHAERCCNTSSEIAGFAMSSVLYQLIMRIGEAIIYEYEPYHHLKSTENSSHCYLLN